uniref:Uncharacterized protein n=1 Tax=Heterorhabditis bacteriophora TaxID=37862 RepID=A0A1I7WDG7_HETBA
MVEALSLFYIEDFNYFVYIFSLMGLYFEIAKLLIWKWVSHILLLVDICICFKRRRYKSTNESNASLLNLFEVFTCSFLFLFCLFFVLYLTLISVMLLFDEGFFINNYYFYFVK